MFCFATSVILVYLSRNAQIKCVFIFPLLHMIAYYTCCMHIFVLLFSIYLSFILVHKKHSHSFFMAVLYLLCGFSIIDLTSLLLMGYLSVSKHFTTINTTEAFLFHTSFYTCVSLPCKFLLVRLAESRDIWICKFDRFGQLVLQCS